MSSDSNDMNNHLSYREFINFRTDVKEEFREVHKCTERIEEKIDDLAKKLLPIIASDKQATENKKRRWDVRMIVFGSAIGTAFSIATAVTLYVMGLVN